MSMKNRGALGRDVLFAHVPKTGGTTLHRLFEQAVGEGACTGQIKSMQYSKALIAYGNARVISGHLWFSPGEQLSGSRTNVTFLREPLDRALSHYYFSRNDVGYSLGGTFAETQFGLMEYVLSGDPSVLGAISNFQSRLFAPLGSAGNIPSTDEELWSAAKRAIDCFDCIGVYDDFNDSVNIILNRCGFSPNQSVPRERATSSRIDVADLSIDLRLKLESLNQVDIELYQYAKEKFKTFRSGVLISLMSGSEVVSESCGEVVQQSLTKNNESGPVKPSLDTPPLQSIAFGSKEVKIVSGQVVGEISRAPAVLLCGEQFHVNLEFESEISVSDLTFGISIRDSDQGLVFGTNTWLLGKKVSVESGSRFSVNFSGRNIMGIGSYSLGISVHTGNSHLDKCFDWRDQYLKFDVVGVVGYHFEGRTNLDVGAALRARIGSVEWHDLVSDPRYRSLGIHNAVVDCVGGSVDILTLPSSMLRGEVAAVEINFRNDCDVRLNCVGVHCLRFSYRWYTANGALLLAEGQRTSMGTAIEVGASVRLWVNVTAPFEFVGPAVLRIVPVQEEVAWFDDISNVYADVSVEIT
ncbi:Wzt carbohydrate-binding domain-containing protein [Burkholderia contaminans]|uniref:Wzt carbohydrate-binding domain-containing protein n=1 Tax=Burkholderia contaminans TaxID=488447 RepID=UPI001453727E|nr:Wzt carbohydrate-binding domain-containing protein [Burkholderia contaminans]MCA8154888.1 Wzt carbohydrate-binding domain-containing protein [Burkholderia contaminans]VWD34298.1 capsule polysaccharide biosynthesis protein [Burkholderia contaminans]